MFDDEDEVEGEGDDRAEAEFDEQGENEEPDTDADQELLMAAERASSTPVRAGNVLNRRKTTGGFAGNNRDELSSRRILSELFVSDHAVAAEQITSTLLGDLIGQEEGTPA